MLRLAAHHIIGAAGKIHHGLTQGLIHGDAKRPETANPLLIPNSLGERLPQNNGNILHRVMRINVRVPLGVHLQVEGAMDAERREHVVEEGNTCVNVAFPGTIQVNGDGDVGFAGGSGHCGRAGGRGGAGERRGVCHGVSVLSVGDVLRHCVRRRGTHRFRWAGRSSPAGSRARPRRG